MAGGAGRAVGVRCVPARCGWVGAAGSGSAAGGGVGVPLVIAGTGPLEPEVTAWAAGRDDVRYVGLYDTEECRRAIARSVAVVAPSTWLEAFGLVVVEDAETGQQLFVDTHDAAFRSRFASLASGREAALRAALSAAGADCIELSTEDHLVDTLMRFARLRKRRAQLASGGVPPALIR